MRTQGCRDSIDWVEQHCHGLSKEGINEVKTASKFVRDRAPYLDLQSTRAITTVRTIQDPIIQGKVLQMIKQALETKTDPRNGDKLQLNLVGVITTPMIKWMILWAETGEKPPYIRRGSAANLGDVTAILVELATLKQDRRTGDYVVTLPLMEKIKAICARIEPIA